MPATPVWMHLRVTVPVPLRDPLAVLLTDWGAEGVVEEEDGLGAYYPPSEHAQVEQRLRGFAAAAAEPIRWSWERQEGEPWRDAWKTHFHPFRVSPRLAVCPSWEPCPDYGPGVRVLHLDPGRAFGTGAHETTRLCLRLLDALLDRRPASRALDVGCGSGILSVAAARLGTECVVGLDVDPEAAHATHENAARNGVAQEVSVFCGDLRSVRGAFPLVAANILYQILLGLAPALAARTAPGGHLILSGLLTGETTSATRVYGSRGFREIRREIDGEWAALVLERSG